MKIKVKLKDSELKLNVIKKGDWIDLYVAEDVPLVPNVTKGGGQGAPRFKIIPLNIAMQLPKGYEAIISPRSSIYKSFGLVCANSIGVIDNTYCGNDDWWGLPVLIFKRGTLKKGDRICQFRIQLSQKATFLQKMKWLFTSKIEFKYVKSLSNNNRGGFGSTGKS